MKKKRLIALSLYTAFGLICLGLSLYFTFPASALGQRISHEIARNTRGAWHVTFEDVSTYRLSGVIATGITAKRDIPVDSPLTVQLQGMHARLRLSPLLLGRTSYDLGAPWGKGYMSLRLSPRTAAPGTNALPAGSIEGSFDDVDLGQPPMLQKFVGLPFGGVLNGDYTLESDGSVRKLEGAATLAVGHYSLGPGSIAGFTLPQIDLGNLEMSWEIKDGRARLTAFKQEGGSIALKVMASVDLASPLAASRLDMCVQFRAEPAFLAANPKMRTVLQLAEVQLKRDGEGFLHLPMSGPIAQPTMHPGLCRRSN
jgi:type II secretion system protein N